MARTNSELLDLVDELRAEIVELQKRPRITKDGPDDVMRELNRKLLLKRYKK